MSKMGKIFWLLVYFLSPLITISIFYIITPDFYHTPLHMLATGFAIAAYVWLTYEFILTSRPKFLDQNFGMDKIIDFHAAMSVVALLLGTIHAIIIINIRANLTQIGTGLIHILLYAIIMVLGLTFLSNTVLLRFKPFQRLSNGTTKLLTIRYHVAKAIHNITMIATIVLYFHLLVATATTYSVLLQIIYTIHFVIGVVFWMNHKFIRTRRIRKNPYKITEVIQDTTLIWSLKITPENGEIFKYQPGQYIYLTIFGKYVSKEPHPFTIASSPTQKQLILTIKESGDYTSNIGTVEIGDKAYIDGPYGIFKPLESEAEEIVFIAGGVGITPFLSALRFIRDNNDNESRNITLIWGIRIQEEMILESEFEEFKKKIPNFTMIHVLSEDDDWAGECGFVDRDRLDRYAACEDPDEAKQKKDYYICGPKEMSDKVIPTLRLMGVSKKYIHLERFG